MVSDSDTGEIRGNSRSQPPSAKADGLSLPDPAGRNDRLVDRSLARDVSSANEVGIRGKAALLAGEKGLRFTIRFRNKATLGTSFGRVAWVNKNNHYPGNLSFVLDKGAKLEESPRLVSTPLRAPNRAIADALEVFKDNLAMRVFRFRHESLRNHVVDRAPEAGLPPRQFLKVSFSRFSSFALERCFERVNFFSDLIYHLAGVKLTIAVNGKVNNAQVHSQCARRVVRGGFGGINNGSEVEDTVAQNKVGLSDHSVDTGFLVCPDSDRQNLPAFEGKDRHPIKSFPGENTLVVDHCRVWLENRLNRAVSLVGFRDFTNSTDSQLGRKPKTPNISINSLLKAYLIGCFKFKGKSRDIVASLIKPLHRLKQGIVLLLVRRKFNYQGLYHTPSLALLIRNVNSILRKEVCVNSSPA